MKNSLIASLAFTLYIQGEEEWEYIREKIYYQPLLSFLYFLF